MYNKASNQRGSKKKKDGWPLKTPFAHVNTSMLDKNVPSGLLIPFGHTPPCLAHHQQSPELGRISAWPFPALWLNTQCLDLSLFCESLCSLNIFDVIISWCPPARGVTTVMWWAPSDRFWVLFFLLSLFSSVSILSLVLLFLFCGFK